MPGPYAARSWHSLKLRVTSVNRLLRPLGLRRQRPLFRATGQDPERVRRWRDEEFPAIILSAVSARGEWRFMLVKGRVNGVVFAELLRRLMHNASHPVFLILDGHSIHRSRPVRDFVASQEGRLRLFFLPPYSPELNPDEQVWNYVKHHGVGKAALHGASDLRKFVLARLRSLQRLPWTVRMFFLTPDTQYAAS
jgi:transposase